MNSVVEIDTAIKASGLTECEILRAAGFAPRYLYNVRSGYRSLTPRTVTRLRLAMSQLKRQRAAEEKGRDVGLQFPQRSAAVRSYRLAVALVSQSAGETPQFVLAADPGKRATADAQWMRAARLRRLALYITSTYLDIPQAELARAVGVSKATICVLLKELGDERDQPEIEAILASVEGAFQI
jgi:transcriptional regulator with XRE-family HTH domain